MTKSHENFAFYSNFFPSSKTMMILKIPNETFLRFTRYVRTYDWGDIIRNLLVAIEVIDRVDQREINVIVWWMNNLAT